MTSPRSAAFVVVLGATLVASTADAREPAPYDARTGLAVASSAARAWASDAVLVYVENDEDLTDVGTADRWGYLYTSISRGASRSYSVRDGRILQADDLEMAFGTAYRVEHDGQAVTMLLMRGVFHGGEPDATTWMVIYSAEAVPSLFVVVDASSGRVVRTWKG